MVKKKLPRIISNVKPIVKKRSPGILIGLSIVGMATTTVLAVKATPKALELLEAEKRRINHENLEEAKKKGDVKLEKVEKLELIDTIRVTWKCYIPAAITFGVSVTCLIGASTVYVRRNAALAAAYSLTETTLRDYRQKVIDTVGEKKEEIIRDEVAKEQLNRDPVQTKEVIFTKNGDTLCYDTISGRYFRSDIEKIRRAVNDVNRTMRDEMFTSLNDFYYEIQLPPIKLGDDLGWNIDEGYMDIRFSSQLAEDGTPCLVLDYSYGPRYDFRNLM